MSEVGKFNFKWIRKIYEFDISNKLIFIDSFQFLNGSVVKNLSENNFKYLCQEFDLV